MPPLSTAEAFWSSRPALMSVAEVAPLLQRTDPTVASLAGRHEIGAYKVAGRWLIARIDVRGFASNDARAAKSDIGLVLDPAPDFTGDVGGAVAHLPELLPRQAVAELLRVGDSKLAALGIEIDTRELVDRVALVRFLQAVSNFGPHYSAAPA